MLKSRSYLHLHFLVFLWGFTAILGLLINLSFPEVVFYRTLISFLAFIPIIYVANVSFKVNTSVGIKLIFTGILISLHWLLFFGAARYANASVSLIGLATTSLWTALIEPLVLKKRIRILEVLFGAVIIVGIYIIYVDDFNFGLGLAMSIGSAFFAAVFTVANSLFVKKHHPLQITFYEMGGALIATIPFVIWYMQSNEIGLGTPSPIDWVYLLILALVCTVYANTAWVNILKKISAFASNLVINLEPIYGIILALIIFGKREEMNLGFYWGGAIIILTIFAYPLISKRVKGGLR